jgi:hypothetical protein
MIYIHTMKIVCVCVCISGTITHTGAFCYQAYSGQSITGTSSVADSEVPQNGLHSFPPTLDNLSSVFPALH